MSKVMQSDRQQASKGMRAWRTMEAREGISFAWQVAVSVATLIVIFSRLPGTLLHPQFFAEDGWVWYQQAYNLQWFRTLGITQAGYLQTLPRLVAGVTLLFPMLWAPLIMNLAGAVVQVLPVTALLSRRCTPWGPLPIRTLMAVLYIVIPDAPEVHIVLTNAMWHLAVLQALLAFSAPPLSWRGRISDIILFGIGGLSGPFCILLLPAVAAYYWVRRQSWTLVVLGIISLGVITQIFSLTHSVRNSAARPLGVTPAPLLRIVAGDIFVDSMTGTGGTYLSVSLLVVAAIGGLTILIWGWRSAPLAVRLYIAFAVFALIGSLKDPLVGGIEPRWGVLANIEGIRYFFLPSLMFLWAAAWCAGGGRNILVRYAGLAVLLLTTIGIVRKWPYPPLLSEGHFGADVARFKTLKTGEHMLFPVIDPFDRRMELIKH
jgi:hypothetical protein